MKNNDGERATPFPTPRPQPQCFACGASNPSGLKLQFHVNGHGSVIADWTPSNIWEGFQGFIHGGIVSTVLDEAMSKAVAAAAKPAFTCHLGGTTPPACGAWRVTGSSRMGRQKA